MKSGRTGDMTMRYYNVPSDYPITKAYAYKKAVERFGVNRQSARKEKAGIVYQGDHGSEVYVDWSALPKATHD
jgi:hypothetical protein